MIEAIGTWRTKLNKNEAHGAQGHIKFLYLRAVFESVLVNPR